jgi:signal transduction histidine kinase
LIGEWDSGAAGVTHPLLFECDRAGRVIWMSDYARSVIGDITPLPPTIAEYLRSGESFHIWAVFVMPDTMLVAAQPARTPDPELENLENGLLRRYFHLEEAERKLTARARRNSPGRLSTLRQIERERQRIGSELHTGVGQMLTAVRLQLEFIGAQMPNPAEPVKQAFDRIGWLAQEALEQVRGISRLLYPPEWQRLTIGEALRQLWEVTGIPLRFNAQLHLPPLDREPGHEIKVLLYRAAQEALSNIARHSGASQVELRLETKGEHIVLTIYDNGTGFDAAAAGEGSGIGLRSVRDAVAELSAKFVVESAPGSTTLRVEAPFEAS